MRVLPTGAIPVNQVAKDMAGSSAGTIRTMLNDILASLDEGDINKARANVHLLDERLTPASGHVARSKGGIQYRPEFVLDSVLYADYLRPLSKDEDSLEESIKKLLSI